MRVLMISGDTNVLRPDSAVAQRMVLYGNAVGELHIIVPVEGEQVVLSQNVRVHPTGTSRPLTRIQSIVATGKTMGGVNLITAQDPFEHGMAALRLGEILKVPVELQVHTDIGSPFFGKGFSSQEVKNKMRMAGVSIRLRRASGVRTVSERVAEAVERLGVIRRRISVLPLYVDTKHFLNVDRVPDEKEKSILMVGRLEKEKEYPVALAAFARVHTHLPDTHLYIIGEGKMHKQLRAYAHRMHIASQVTFVGAVADVVPYLTSAHVFLHTAQYEGFGAVLAEAALAGVPIVSTDVGIAGSLLEDGQHARIAPVGDIDHITAALLEVITRPHKSHEMALQASAWMDKQLLPPDAYVKALQSMWEKTAKNV